MQLFEGLRRLHGQLVDKYRRRFFDITGLPEEDDDARIDVALYSEVRLTVDLICKKCGYSVFVCSLPIDDEEAWPAIVAANAPLAMKRFQTHDCQSVLRKKRPVNASGA